MFVDKSNEIIVNEVAPRPHNLVIGLWMHIIFLNLTLVRVIFDMPIPNIKYYHNVR